MSERGGVPGATQCGTRPATARAVPARPFSLWLSRARPGARVASSPGPAAARYGAELSGERRAGAARAAGALRERRAAMDEAADGEQARTEPERRPSAPSPAASSTPASLAAPAGEPEPGASGRGAGSAGPAEAPRSLAALVAAERLSIELLRRERAAGPELRLSLGRTLEVRLVQGAGGVEVAVGGPGPVARLAGAELPALVQALDRGGVRVARAEVRPPARGEEQPARARALTAPGTADRTLVRQG